MRDKQLVAFAFHDGVVLRFRPTNSLPRCNLRCQLAMVRVTRTRSATRRDCGVIESHGWADLKGLSCRSDSAAARFRLLRYAARGAQCGSRSSLPVVQCKQKCLLLRATSLTPCKPDRSTSKATSRASVLRGRSSSLSNVFFCGFPNDKQPRWQLFNNARYAARTTNCFVFNQSRWHPVHWSQWRHGSLRHHRLPNPRF